MKLVSFGGAALTGKSKTEVTLISLYGVAQCPLLVYFIQCIRTQSVHTIETIRASVVGFYA